MFYTIPFHFVRTFPMFLSLVVTWIKGVRSTVFEPRLKGKENIPWFHCKFELRKIWSYNDLKLFFTHTLHLWVEIINLISEILANHLQGTLGHVKENYWNSVFMSFQLKRTSKRLWFYFLIRVKDIQTSKKISNHL